MKKALYPLKFTPILIEKIWGGSKLKSILKKDTTSKVIGESWELSDVKGFSSKINNGSLKGTSLKTLLKQYQEDLLGIKNYKIFGNEFPLLVKFIDANKDLSIQLHPNNKLAQQRHNSFGKTEMWYVMQADNNSEIILGFNKDLNKEIYNRHLNNKTLTKVLNTVIVSEGDSFFVNPGQIHAIGAGVMLAEIQQTSDITYRIYDWDRVDSSGNKRKLHTELAIDAIDFSSKEVNRLFYKKEKNQPNKMVACPYFTTNYLELSSDLKCNNTKDSFIIYLCVEGKAIINQNGNKVVINKGETVLLPASIKDYSVVTNYAKLLEVYV